MDSISTCAACGQTATAAERLFCPRCGQAQHRTCIQHNQGCAAPGCGHRFTVPDSAPGVARSGLVPGPDPPVPTIACPRCKHREDVRLSNCSSCGASLRASGAPLVVVLLLVVLGFFTVVPIMAAILIPNFIRARAQGQCTACKSNLKNIGTALEMYSTDYEGRYPPSMDCLTRKVGNMGPYLTRIPMCPAAQRDTYSSSYQVSSAPDMYTFWCQGENHRAVRLPANYPAYSAMEGLMERP